MQFKLSTPPHYSSFSNLRYSPIRKSFLTPSQKLGYRSMSAFNNPFNNPLTHNLDTLKYSIKKPSPMDKLGKVGILERGIKSNVDKKIQLRQMMHKQKMKVPRVKLEIEQPYSRNYMYEVQAQQLKKLVHNLNSENYQLKEINQQQSKQIQQLTAQLNHLQMMYHPTSTLKPNNNYTNISSEIRKNRAIDGRSESQKVVYYLSEINKRRNEEIDQINDMLY